MNAISLTITSEHDGDSLSKVDGVKNVWPVVIHKLPTTFKSKKKPTDPEVASLHSMTGVDVVQKKYKLTGKGIKVGVIDTGLDYKHPAFAVPGAKEGCFGKGCRVQYGYDFVGDAFDGSKGRKEDKDPMDCEGHGTHVAGIIGGNALHITSPKPPTPFVGVAPEVTFGAYRIFGCEGGSPTDIIMAAMERAAEDKMDIINMSLGGGSSFKNNAIAVLADKLVKRGVAVSAAAGNDGSEGVWMVSDAGLGDLSSSVASFDNISGFYHSYKYGTGSSRPYKPSSNWNKPINPPASATLVPLFEKDGSLSDGCDPAVYKDVSGKVVLAFGDFSRCGSGARATVAKNAGAAAMLVQTSPYGFSPIGGIESFPMASIENRSGDELLAIWKSTPNAAFNWSKDGSKFLIEGGGSPSDFSSLGLDGDLRSKPDIAAPGGNILSTLPLKQGGYGVQSGTSMATPYLVGTHALYLDAKKARPRGDEVRLALKNTATIGSNWKSDTKSSVAKQGAGLVNILNAIEATTSITPDHIDLLDSKHLKPAVISIKNFGKNSETYTLSHIPADALNSYPKKNTFPLAAPIIEDDYATVSFSANKITIPAGKTAKITLSFKEPKKGKSTQFPIYSGFVIATPKSKGGVPVHVPYTGLKGDVSKIPIFDKGDSGYPSLTALNGKEGTHGPVAKGFTFDFNQTFPLISARLGSHSPDVTIRVFESGSDKFVGFIDSANNGAGFGSLGRNNGPLSASYDWIWNGFVYTKESKTTKTKKVADGKYRIEIAAQKKLTKGSYPKDFERKSFGTIKIKSA
ncbi:hypothetical protein BGX31_009626 [Mortierella sp. GBA43]|nr:hypothetical protein BGX31_009626 [Mortierella sp. GBA43]